MEEPRSATNTGPGLGLPAGVTIRSLDGIDLLEVDGGDDAVSAQVSLHGAQVLRWAPPGGDEVLFVSDLARFEPGTAIRGGVPVCFPWFGAGPSGDAKPSHGYARTTRWDLESVTREGADVAVRLTMPARDEHPALALDIRLGDTLALVATVTGEPDAVAELALHAYYGVGDAAAVTVRGLEGAAYLDQLTGEKHLAGDEPLTFTGEVDRIYDAAGPFHLDDPALGRRITIEQEGLGCAVLWNPWVAKAARTEDLGDDEWHGFVCVESAAVRGRAIVLGPEGRHVARVVVSVTDLPDDAGATADAGEGAASDIEEQA